jgi:hypothetical protein
MGESNSRDTIVIDWLAARAREQTKQEQSVEGKLTHGINSISDCLSLFSCQRVSAPTRLIRALLKTIDISQKHRSTDAKITRSMSTEMSAYCTTTKSLEFCKI